MRVEDCYVCMCWQQPGRQHFQVFGGERFWESFQTFFSGLELQLGLLGELVAGKGGDEKNWIYVSPSIPWAGAGAFSVHDSSSTSSGTVRPLRPSWPLAVDRPRTMLAILNALTPPTPLENTIVRGKWLIKQSCTEITLLSVPESCPESPSLDKWPAPHLNGPTLQPKHTHMPHTWVN